MQDTTIGVGPALRRARQIRGISLEEAGRDTKLRVGQLEALESEDFDVLPGDPWVRGSLRTYAQYLGLSPDKVVGAYARRADEPAAPPPPGRLGRVERAIAATRIRDNQRLLLLAAASLVLVALIFGLLSRDHSAPPPAAIPSTAPSPPSSDRSIDVVLVARRPAQVSVAVDGEPAEYEMAAGETLSFSAERALDLTVADGGSVQVTVNGIDQGAPGEPGRPWRQSFTFDADEGSVTSPAA